MSNREVFMYFDVSPLLTYLVPQNVSTNPNTPCPISLSSISCDASLHGIGSKIPSSSCHPSVGMHGRTPAKTSANYLSPLFLEEHKFQVIFWIKLYGFEWWVASSTHCLAEDTQLLSSGKELDAMKNLTHSRNARALWPIGCEDQQVWGDSSYISWPFSEPCNWHRWLLIGRRLLQTEGATTRHETTGFRGT